MTMMDLKTFGCTIFVHIPAHLRSKLDPRVERCVFLGYAPNKRGYKCFNPKTGKIYFSMDVVFLEKKHFFIPNDLQRESKSEDHFWQTSIPFPNTIFPEVFSEVVNPMNISNSENSDQGIVSSQTEVEPPLLEQPAELHVYSRKRYHLNNRV
ncbi:hypothetical protein Patl1_34427 [Pistacia atlantica]|uniref:Uncharacterized protein n=1 Tax=Pistacia atlantica TaxID=434234 RepID=A0ACC0ZSP4_9ROSI|nr:hypothetical protein Patl1_34427 [Pistacia atlantica]